MPDTRYSINAVAQRTGLTLHVIRVWEKRYGAVIPKRTGTNRRFYCEAEIDRLILLREARQKGHSIGDIAKIPDDALARLVSQGSAGVTLPAPQTGPSKVLESCLAATRSSNARQFEETLVQAMLQLGHHGLLEKVIGPLAQEIGNLWREGSMTAAHEHFASAVIRNFLVGNFRRFANSLDMPCLVITTPAGQYHELGAVIVAAAANDLGWRTVYLGTSLPAAEIAGAVIQNRALAIALSIVYPLDDPLLSEELHNLRRYLGSIPIIVGGRAADAYGRTLQEIGAARPADLGALCNQLDAIRAKPTAGLETRYATPLRATGAANSLNL